jgi:hypothetical protein
VFWEAHNSPAQPGGQYVAVTPDKSGKPWRGDTFGDLAEYIRLSRPAAIR